MTNLQATQMDKLGLISTNLAGKIAMTVTKSPYRVMAGTISGTCGGRQCRMCWSVNGADNKQAKTVRKIFDLYLVGNGYHKIMKRLEKNGHRMAMGKTMWHCATVGHILKNRLYCGELEYRKEYVPDYLEQKRAKNKGVHSDDLWRRKMRCYCDGGPRSRRGRGGADGSAAG